MTSIRDFKLPPAEKKTERVFEKAAGVFAARHKKEIIQVDIDQLKPYAKQVRRDFSNLQGMVESIKEVGISQPLTVIPDPDSVDKFQIISGERRWRAAKEVGLKTIPCNVIEEDHAVKISVIENLQRKDLTPIEKGEAFSLFVDQGISERRLSEILEENRWDINICLRLFKSPDWIKNPIIQNKIHSLSDIQLLLQKADEGEDAFKNTFHRLNKTGKPHEYSSSTARKKNILHIFFDEGKDKVSISTMKQNFPHIDKEKQRDIILQIEKELNELKKKWNFLGVV